MSKGKHNFSNICVESSLFDFIDKEACNGLDIKAKEFFEFYKKFYINSRRVSYL